MAADWGVYHAAAATPAGCGPDAGWTHVGMASTGLGSLQVFQVAGQVHYPITGNGVSISGFTSLFLGTMDNLIWVVRDTSQGHWNGTGLEGSFLQALYDATTVSATDAQFTYMDFEAKAKKRVPNFQTGTWAAEATWTAASPPGTNTPPVLISAQTYVQWSGATVFLTTDGGATWSPLGMLPASANPNNSNPLNVAPFGASQVTKTTAGPALFEFVGDNAGASGLALLTNLSPAATPRTLEVRTLGGLNNQGLNSGLQGIMGNCFAAGDWYCQPVYAADPNDYRNLIAADPGQQFMAKSVDAGQHWQSLPGLTSLVTGGGTLSFTDAIGGCQAHVIAYDPGNSAHILVGTDQAGIIASANGGATWSALPNTARATAITSIFFDDRAGVAYVATFGRGLWKLTVDWSTVP
jgi:hypothetical protein